MRKKYLICMHPFYWYDVAWNKEVYLCCQGWLNKSVGNAIEQTPKEIWNSEDAKKIRTSVIDGSFKYCNKEHCPFLMNKTYPVKYVYEKEYNNLKKSIESNNTSILPGLLNFGYDKTCNLTCPSCRKEVFVASKTEQDQYVNIANNTLAEFGESAELIYITGSGEPFASKHYFDLLTSNELLKYPKLKVKIHTNAQLCTTERWEKIKHIEDKITILEISIDAASAQTYSLNRKPGNWDVLCKNMEHISELRKTNRIKYLQLDFVVQDNNYSEMIKFVELGKAWNVDTVRFSILNNWETFSEEEYLSRAIHKPEHKNHSKFLEILKDPILDDPIVFCNFKNSYLNKSMKIGKVLKKIKRLL